MPRAKWTAKDERKYKHILASCKVSRGRKKGVTKLCKRIAAATVNRDRALGELGLGSVGVPQRGPFAPPGLGAASVRKEPAAYAVWNDATHKWRRFEDRAAAAAFAKERNETVEPLFKYRVRFYERGAGQDTLYPRGGDQSQTFLAFDKEDAENRFYETHGEGSGWENLEPTSVELARLRGFGGTLAEHRAKALALDASSIRARETGHYSDAFVKAVAANAESQWVDDDMRRQTFRDLILASDPDADPALRPRADTFGGLRGTAQQHETAARAAIVGARRRIQTVSDADLPEAFLAVGHAEEEAAWLPSKLGEESPLWAETQRLRKDAWKRWFARSRVDLAPRRRSAFEGSR